MAEEAFALSPISARPNVPGEADYEAIREAFMETARGRWFLAEYAKRNRTADTALVLEAVTRLEANLAAQKQAPALSLVAALAAIRSAVRQAKATAIEVLPRIDIDETLTGARNGVRIIREIAWTLRECGADTRICDLLDTHVKAIEAGQQALGGNGRDDVLASYDLLMQRIEQMVDGLPETSSPSTTTAATTPKPTETAAETREASVTPLFKPQASENISEPAAMIRPEPVVAAARPAAEEQAVTDRGAVETSTSAAMAQPAATEVSQEPIFAAADMRVSVDMSEAASEPAAVQDEHSLAALDMMVDMVAAEMGVIDSDESDVSEPAVVQTDVPMPQPAAAQAAAPVERDAMNADLMTLAQIAEAALAPEAPQPEVVKEVAPQPTSLGAALIANGVVPNPAAPISDPLSPIRKMTQAEKIAFFS